MSTPLTFDLTAEELDIFLVDVNECLQGLETGILSLERKADPETLHALFRAAHTLKALAGMVGHPAMAELTHALETLFDNMRQAKLSSTPGVADELLATVDTLKIMRDEVVNQQASGLDTSDLLQRLHHLTVSEETLARALADLGWGELTASEIAKAQEWYEQGYTLLELELTVQAETFAPGARLYQACLSLLEIGQLVAQRPTTESLTETDRSMWLLLATQADQADLEIHLGELPDLAQFRLQVYDIDKLTAPSPSELAIEAHTEDRPSKLVEAQGTVRISVERLDTLLNLVGELVTNRTRLIQIETILQAEYGRNNGVGALGELIPQFSHVVNQLQEEVMRARMLPIAHLFNKFPRMVRELARKAGKQVDLIISGETTELDRTIIEAIADPLLHLLRNAIDHGLEMPETRLAAGKPPSGTIHLAAEALEGQITITVADDGRGIDPAQVRQVAVERGLLSPEEAAQLSDDEAIELIFQPNLSTAREVTELSGRGVGMDVVRTNIERLSGSVTITNQPEQGTTFHLTLPLTLALIQTMLVSVRNNLYAIPVTAVNGAIYLAEAGVETIKGKPAMEWQGAIIPLLDLRQHFNHPRLAGEASTGLKPTVVLVTWGKLQVGLIVDKIIDQQEIVIKALSPLLGHLPGLSGATILGDGRIALIIDIPGVINSAVLARR
jgi:two-component system chemotaxis sensor kinase CheA